VCRVLFYLLLSLLVCFIVLRNAVIECSMLYFSSSLLWLVYYIVSLNVTLECIVFLKLVLQSIHWCTVVFYQNLFNTVHIFSC